MTFNFKKISKKVWIPVASFLAVLLISGIALAATVLNQTYPAKITINPEPTQPPEPTSIIAYSDSSWTTALVTIGFGEVPYNGGTAYATVYVKPAEMNASAVTVTPSGLPDGYSISKYSYDDTTGEIQISLSVPSGQTPGVDIPIGNITLNGTKD